jgi:hypothetical protein
MAQILDMPVSHLDRLPGTDMKRTLLAVLLCSTISTPALALPLYAGIQIDDTSTGVLFGYQIDNTYAVELQYLESNTSITHAGINVDSKVADTSIVGIARFPMKLRKKVPYYLFVKAGYVHSSITDDYSIPASVTLTLPYNDTKTSDENQLILGGGAMYNFSKHLTGRVGMDLKGTDRIINLVAIYRF